MFDRIARSNVNSLWGAITAEVLQRLGLRTVIISPGSRSTPLTFAFARHSALEALPILDERSASFFALGLARRSNNPVALVCTSGTAAANFYPAVIEARESRVPLLVLTADRPPELRHCRAGQTIDQLKIYGNFPNFQAELALPSERRDRLKYLRQTLVHAWERAQLPIDGPVHLNFPFREPLAPDRTNSESHCGNEFDFEGFISQVRPLMRVTAEPPKAEIERTIRELKEIRKGLIVAGPHFSENAENFVGSVGRISRILGWPVIADALGPLRMFAKFNPVLITNYDAILRNLELAKHLAPEAVLSVGPLPTSKVLRKWLEKRNIKTWLIDTGPENVDPLHRDTIPLRIAIETFARYFEGGSRRGHRFLSLWLESERAAGRLIAKKMRACDFNFEGRVAHTLSKALPPKASLIVANSMPVRDMEYFWQPGNSRIEVYSNRGANGIDGTLSTALGIAHGGGKCFLLTGDLAFLHDTNGLLLGGHFKGHLTIVLVNNRGGGIFEALPVAQHDPPFEEYFATPQIVNFGELAGAYGVEHQCIDTVGRLVSIIKKGTQARIRILEIRTDRKRDTKYRHELLEEVAASLSSKVTK